MSTDEAVLRRAIGMLRDALADPELGPLSRVHHRARLRSWLLERGHPDDVYAMIGAALATTPAN